MVLIALVADQHNGDRAGVSRLSSHLGRQRTGACRRIRVSRLFNPLYLRIELLDPLKGVSGCNTVDEDETLSISYPLVAESGIFFLSSRIQHFEHASLLINHDLFAIGVFDGWVIGLHEMVQT